MRGRSQTEIAGELGISRSSFVQIELGNRNLSANELKSLSSVFHLSIDRLLSDDFSLSEEVINDEQHSKIDVRIAVPELNAQKFRNILLYILEKCAGKPNVGETVLYKLLYFSEFNFYELYEEHMAGAEFKKLPYGPVPTNLQSIIVGMIERGELDRIKTNYCGYDQTRYLPLTKPDLKQFSAAEKEVIDQVIRCYSDWNATKISEYSHEDVPWKVTREGEVIDYELAFYRESPYSVRNYNENGEKGL